MTTPIDTTRLRADAEAVRAAQKALYADAHPDAIILALLDEVEGLRARLDEAYPRALQAAANEVSECAARWRMDEDGEPPDLDAVVDRILEMDADAIDEFARQCALDHEAATVADHFVCPGCHVVDDEPCLPGCIDAEIDGERRRPFDGFSEFNADDGDDEGDEPEEGGAA